MSRIVFVGRVDEFFRRERCAAFLTLVAVCAFSAAARAGADDVAVGEKFACYFIAELLLGFLHELVVVVKRAEEIRGKLVVDLRGRSAVDVE